MSVTKENEVQCNLSTARIPAKGTGMEEEPRTAKGAVTGVTATRGMGGPFMNAGNVSRGRCRMKIRAG